MAATPRDIILRTTRARNLMARSREGGWAVGAFNADNLETLRAICRAARAKAAPVLIELSHSEVEVIGLENARDVLDNEIAALGIEAYLNLDHAPSGSAAMSAIDAGFEFVHLDLFRVNGNATADEVIAATRGVVEYARHTGAIVEGEQRSIPGSSTLHSGPVDRGAIASSLSSPKEARAFADATGIDILAVGIGNVHGRYTGGPTLLDLELLTRVRAAVDVHLSLHGGSGTHDGVYRAIARGGVSKININSDLRISYRKGLERQLARHPEQYGTAKLIGPVVDAMQHVVEKKIHAFGSAGKARP